MLDRLPLPDGPQVQAIADGSRYQSRERLICRAPLGNSGPTDLCRYLVTYWTPEPGAIWRTALNPKLTAVQAAATVGRHRATQATYP